LQRFCVAGTNAKSPAGVPVGAFLFWLRGQDLNL
jgi:hypothetical protein